MSNSLTLRIDGMHCGACVRRVTQALQKVEGAEVQEVRIGAARVQVEDAAAAESDLLASIANAGYSAHVEP
jgi:copper chaperone